MIDKTRKTMFRITITILTILGIWQIYQGETGFGVGLISAAVGVSAGKKIRQSKIRELQAKGLNPFDERVSFIANKAAMATWKTIVLLMAVFILLGSVFGPQISVNPYNFLGFWLAIVVIVYYGYYYYYSRTC
ncbi:MAG: DUF2178 domain-containing protein [Syntrophomonadaceae bacterium]|nr:DUF2178 domain-containing protein [Syntrophomonadaceae bacterium]